MKNLVILLMMLTFFARSSAQNISREEANNLVSALRESKADTARISLLLRIAKFHIFKPGEAKADMDSALLLINQAQQLNLRLRSRVCDGNIILHKSYYLKENGQRELAKASLERVAAQLRNQDVEFLLGEIYFELSEYYSYESVVENEKKISLIEQAKNCFQHSGAIERVAYCYKVLGDLYFQMGDKTYSDKALAALDSSLVAYQAINYPAVQGIYIFYSSIYSYRSNYIKALPYALLAIETAEKVKDTSMQLCQINYVTGINYYHLRQYEKALPYLYTALQVAEKYRHLISIYLVQYSICENYIYLNRAPKAKAELDQIVAKYGHLNDPIMNLEYNRMRVVITEQLKDLNDLEYYCNKCVEQVRNVQLEPSARFKLYHTLIKGYLRLRNYSLTRFYLVKANDVLKHMALSNRNLRLYDSWFSLDTATRDYKSAVYHLLEYNKVNDSIFDQTKTQQIQQLQVEYDTEQKDNNIRLLTQEKIIQQSELKRSMLIRNIIIATAGLLLVILFLLYNQFRLKQRNSKIIQKKNAVLEHMINEKEWLLKEVHHRVKNNLQTVVSLLELQSENLSDEALSAIQDSQNRIYAMSLIHQKLYQTDDIASINMQPYLLELTNHLQAIYDPAHKINFDQQVASVKLDVSQAIPVGLIVNEAVTNSIKYAFNYGASHSEISIVLRQSKKNNLRLVIADNGIGLPMGFDITETNGLGFKLMKGLVDDIDGELAVESDQGTAVKVVFRASIPFVEKVYNQEREKALVV